MKRLYFKLRHIHAAEYVSQHQAKITRYSELLSILRSCITNVPDKDYGLVFGDEGVRVAGWWVSIDAISKGRITRMPPGMREKTSRAFDFVVDHVGPAKHLVPANIATSKAALRLVNLMQYANENRCTEIDVVKSLLNLPPSVFTVDGERMQLHHTVVVKAGDFWLINIPVEEGSEEWTAEKIHPAALAVEQREYVRLINTVNTKGCVRGE